MTISTMAGLIAAPKQKLPFMKVSATNPGGFNWLSWWRVAGLPGVGTDPSAGVAGVALTKADAGAFAFINPASGLTYLVRFQGNALVEGNLSLYDRLWHNSGLSPTLTTAQTVNSVTLPARCPVLSDASGETFDTNGNLIEPWIHVMGTAMGAGTVAPTITYTSESGATGRVGTQQQFQSAMASNRTFPFGLAAGDTGVRSIQSYQQTATQTAGVFSLVLRRKIATIRLPMRERQFSMDWDGLALPVIPNDAHLELIFQPASSVSTPIQGEIILAQG